MAVKIWDSASNAFKDADIPMRYDATSDAMIETTGKVYNQNAQVWEEKWGTVQAHVYGAVNETVTIKKRGIVIDTVTLGAGGVSGEPISLSPGTYTLSGSVSGYTREQEVTKDTTKFLAMPEGALYWYGNDCSNLSNGWASYQSGCETSSDDYPWTTYEMVKKTNDIYFTARKGQTIISPCNPIDSRIYNSINVIISTNIQNVLEGSSLLSLACIDSVPFNDAKWEKVKTLALASWNGKPSFIINKQMFSYPISDFSKKYIALSGMHHDRLYTINVHAFWLE